MVFKRIFTLSLALLQVVFLTTPDNLQAIFPSAQTLFAKKQPKTCKKTVHILADWHARHKGIAPQQIHDTVTSIVAHTPDETVALVENSKSFTPEMFGMLQNNGFFARISRKLKSKNIETHDLDYRFAYDAKRKDIVDYMPETASKYVSVKDYLQQITQQIRLYKSVMSKDQMRIFREIKKIITRNNLYKKPAKVLVSFFKNHSTIREQEFIDFADSLVDVAMLYHIFNTEKNHIFVIAGWWHTNNVVSTLQKSGFEVVHENGPSFEEFSQEFDVDNATVQKGQIIPAVNIPCFLAQAKYREKCLENRDYINDLLLV